MKRFVIPAPSWFPSSGGITILHKLVHVLNELGYDAYLAPSAPSCLGWYPSDLEFSVPERYDKIKFITEDVLDNLQDAVVIYAEGCYGNYLNAPNVVRWMLGPANPKYMVPITYYGKYIPGWGESDLWFWYTDLYKTPAFTSYQKHFENTLYLPEFLRSIFKNTNQERILNCWTLRKSTGRIDPKDYIHESGDLFLGHINKALPNPDYDFPGNYHKLAALFNKTNRFYSYDAYTFVSVQAVMCGADSIVFPMKNLDKDSYLNGNALHKYIAYGVDDLDRARAVRNELEHHMDEIEASSINQIHEFVNKCNDYFK